MHKVSLTMIVRFLLLFLITAVEVKAALGPPGRRAREQPQAGEDQQLNPQAVRVRRYPSSSTRTRVDGAEGSSSKLRTPAIGGYHKCDSNWRRTRRDWKKNRRRVWKNPSCYTYTLRRTCNCPAELSGPFRIRVRDGAVEDIQPPSTPSFPRNGAPTMGDLFRRVGQQCVRPCERDDDSVGADECRVTYGPEHGNIETLYIDRERMMADEEISIQISDFELCD